MNSILSLSRSLVDQGIASIPVGADKRPPEKFSWRAWQDNLPNEATLQSWWPDGSPLGVAIIGGKVQCLDFDVPKNGKSKFPEFRDLAEEFGLGFTLERLVCQRTPSGGIHLVWICKDDLRNTKLAQREDNETLIETRGKGGYFLVSPSSGYEIQQGSFESIPVITEEEREALLDLARSFDERKKEESRESESSPRGSSSDELSPADDYDLRGDVEGLLIKHGWTSLRGKYWRRPDKEKGVSATFGHIPNRFWVFSSSTSFKIEHLYKPWHVFAHLEHGGDFSAAVGALRRSGFGSKSSPPNKSKAAGSSTIFEGDQEREGYQPETESSGKPIKRLELPPIYTIDEEEEQEWPRPPELIRGILYQGAKGMIAGPSKARKTFSLSDLAISVAAGLPWMGFETNQAPVLYLNLELQSFAFRDRRRDIQNAKMGSFENIPLFTWHLRGYGVDLPRIARQVLDVCQVEGIGLVIIDPTYKLNEAGEENAASDVGALLNQFEQLALQANTAVVFAHHFAKGNAGEKDSIDRASGSGVWARDPDAIITLNNHEKEDHMIVETSLRNFKRQDPFVIAWNYPLWERALDEDATAHKGKKKRGRGAPTKAVPEDLIEAIVKFGGEFKSNLVPQYAKLLGVSKPTIWRLWKEIKTARGEE